MSSKKLSTGMETKIKHPKNWRKVKLGEFVEINPRVRLIRGKKYFYIDMADVQPFSRIKYWERQKIRKRN